MSTLPTPGTYSIDASHSHVGFAVKHFGLSKVRGEFQKFDGTIASAGSSGKVENGSLAGDRLSFTAVVEAGGGPARHEFSGRIAGGRISGQLRVTRNGEVREVPWSAKRVEKREPRHFSLPPPTPFDLPR